MPLTKALSLLSQLAAMQTKLPLAGRENTREKERERARERERERARERERPTVAEMRATGLSRPSSSYCVWPHPPV